MHYPVELNVEYPQKLSRLTAFQRGCDQHVSRPESSPQSGRIETIRDSG
jgi:hypothetical protein